MNKTVDNFVIIFLIFVTVLAWVVSYLQHLKLSKHHLYGRQEIKKNSPYNPKNRKNKKKTS